MLPNAKIKSTTFSYSHIHFSRIWFPFFSIIYAKQRIFKMDQRKEKTFCSRKLSKCPCGLLLNCCNQFVRIGRLMSIARFKELFKNKFGPFRFFQKLLMAKQLGIRESQKILQLLVSFLGVLVPFELKSQGSALYQFRCFGLSCKNSTCLLNHFLNFIVNTRFDSRLHKSSSCENL